MIEHFCENVMRWAISYYLYNLKNREKNPMEEC